MPPQELDSTSASDVEFDALATSKPEATRSRFTLMTASVGFIIASLLLLSIAAFLYAPETWYRWFLSGLITGFALGSVFGIWIGRRIGNAPNLQKLSFATVIVVLNACVGFFGYAYLTSESVPPNIWPKRDGGQFFYSIGIASTLVSATILCLVNFFWHSRDQQRINTLRAVVNKNRARIAEAEAKLAAAHQRAEEANARAEEQRKKSEQAQQEADQARTTASGAQRSAQQAQQIAENEKRWRSHRALLLGRWQCVEYTACPKSDKREMGLAVQKELEKNKDVFFFGADDRFSLNHPGHPTGFLDKIKAQFGSDRRDEADIPTHKTGRWKLDEGGESVLVLFEDGTRQTLNIQALLKSTMTIDRSSKDWEVRRFLVKIE